MVDPDIQIGAKKNPYKSFWIIAGVAITYLVVGRLGLILALPNSNASPMWPAAGLALAFAYLYGTLPLWGIMFGSAIMNFIFLVKLTTASSSYGILLIVSLTTGIAAALQAWSGGLLMHHWIHPISSQMFSKVSHVFKFLLVGTASCLVNSTISVQSLKIFQAIHPTSFFDMWKTWFIGDTVGVWEITPFILAWVQLPYPRLSLGGIGEALCLYVSLIIYGFLYYSLENPFAYIFIIFLAWAAVRFRLRGATLALLITAISITLATANKRGDFVLETINDSLLAMALFLMATTALTLCLAALFSERKPKFHVWRHSPTQFWDLRK